MANKKLSRQLDKAHLQQIENKYSTPAGATEAERQEASDLVAKAIKPVADAEQRSVEATDALLKYIHSVGAEQAAYINLAFSIIADLLSSPLASLDNVQMVVACYQAGKDFTIELPWLRELYLSTPV